MKNPTAVSILLVVTVLSSLTFAGKKPHFAEFSARYSTILLGQPDTGNIFVHHDKVRFETMRNNLPITIIIRYDKGVLWNIMESMQYYEMNIEKCKDIIPLVVEDKKIITVQNKGSEAIATHTCSIITYTLKGSLPETLTHWISPTIHYPLKLVYKKGSVVELTHEIFNITVTPQKKELFEIPKGYQKVILPPELDSFMNK